jgi:hypothetical protein
LNYNLKLHLFQQLLKVIVVPSLLQKILAGLSAAYGSKIIKERRPRISTTLIRLIEAPV